MTATRTLFRSLIARVQRPLSWLALPRAAYLYPWPYEPQEQRLLERELFDCERIANDNCERRPVAAALAPEPERAPAPATEPERVKPSWVRIR